MDLINQRSVMPEQLIFKLITHNEQHSNYDWMNIEHCGQRVGKVRGLINGRTLTICSINIFPEFEGRGFARKTIIMFRKLFDVIIADRVRYTAIGFWKKMEFVPDGDGNYIWKNNWRHLRERLH
jgi:hypothetical protein